LLSFLKAIAAFVVMIVSALPFSHLLPAPQAAPTIAPLSTYLTSSHPLLRRDFELREGAAPKPAPKPAPAAPKAAPAPAAAPVRTYTQPAPVYRQPVYQQPRPVYRPTPRPAPPPAPRIVIGSYQQSLINSDRASAGLRPLSWSSCLASIAYQSASRMAAQGYISHGSAIYQAFGCGLGSAQTGENVGFWSAGINDVQLNSMFMASPEHRANIMGPYHYVGTAWVVAKNGYAYIAVVFG
jgi:uncharacterized protein YkwD